MMQIQAAATAVGTHPQAAFVLGGAALLGAVALAWRAAAVVGARLPRRAATRPHVALLLVLASAFAAMAGAASVLALLAEAVALQAPLGRADEALTAALRANVGPGTLRFFAAITHFGDPPVLWALGVAVALLLWQQRRRWMALGWSLALAGNAVLNPTLKALFARARPEHLHGLVSETGFSFPSGHSSGSVVAYGMLAYLLLRLLQPRWHRVVVLALAALVWSVGCSRVFLQVHYASDVIAGFASGGAWLAVCVLAIESLRRRRRSKGGGPGTSLADGGA